MLYFGGGWVRGGPAQMFGTCAWLSGQGYDCIAAGYLTQNSGANSPWDTLKDAENAYKWLLRSRGRLQLGGQSIVLGGVSAGAQLAAAVALRADEDAGIGRKPKALLLYNPVLNNGPGGYGYEKVRAYWREFSPTELVKAHQPVPAQLFGGKRDLLAKPQELSNFCLSVRKRQSECSIEWYDVGHGSFTYNAGDNPVFEDVMKSTVRFLDRHASQSSSN